MIEIQQSYLFNLDEDTRAFVLEKTEAILAGFCHFFPGQAILKAQFEALRGPERGAGIGL